MFLLSKVPGTLSGNLMKLETEPSTHFVLSFNYPVVTQFKMHHEKRVKRVRKKAGPIITATL